MIRIADVEASIREEFKALAPPPPRASLTSLIHPPVACEEPHVSAILASLGLTREAAARDADDARLRVTGLLRLAFIGVFQSPGLTAAELADALRRRSRHDDMAGQADEPFISAVALRAHATPGDDPALRLAILSDALAFHLDFGSPCDAGELRAMGFSTEEIAALGKDAQAIAAAMAGVTAPEAA